MIHSLRKLRILAWLTILIFSATNATWAQPPAAVPLSTKAGIAVPFPDGVQIPTEFASIQVASQNGNGSPFVILIQNAHAVLDAQHNIQKLIQYLQTHYGIDLVALEGAAGKLDLTLFRSFPDELVKSKVFKDYLEKGEITGAGSAAIFSEKEGRYYGIEDWDLYERNYYAYLRAYGDKEAVHQALGELRKDLDKRREKFFSKELKEFHAHREAFEAENAYLLQLLKYLGDLEGASEKIKQYPQLSRLYDSFEFEKSAAEQQENVDGQVREMAATFKSRFLKKMNIKDEMQFHRNYQTYVTGGMEPGQFLKYMLEIGRKMGLKPRLTPAMMRLIGHSETLASIKGTKLFDELEALFRDIENDLVQKPEERELIERYRRLRLLGDLANLEVTRAQLDEFRDDPDGFLDLLKDSRAHLQSALEFYRLALERDEAFKRNLMETLKQQKAKAAIVVAGGFHTQGFEKNLDAEGVSYLVIMPNIGSLAGHEFYPELMHGRLSYKRDLDVSFYDAFAKHSTAKLVAELNQPDFRKALKLWRDNVIRKLNEEGRIAEAKEYTQYIDLLFKVYRDRFGGEGPASASREDILSIIREELDAFREKTLSDLWNHFQVQLNAFTEGLQFLTERKALTAENVSVLIDQAGAVSPAAVETTGVVVLNPGAPQSNTFLQTIRTGISRAETRAIADLATIIPPREGFAPVLGRAAELVPAARPAIVTPEMIRTAERMVQTERQAAQLERQFGAELARPGVDTAAQTLVTGLQRAGVDAGTAVAGLSAAYQAVQTQSPEQDVRALPVRTVDIGDIRVTTGPLATQPQTRAETRSQIESAISQSAARSDIKRQDTAEFTEAQEIQEDQGFVLGSALTRSELRVDADESIALPVTEDDASNVLDLTPVQFGVQDGQFQIASGQATVTSQVNYAGFRPHPKDNSRLIDDLIIAVTYPGQPTPVELEYVTSGGYADVYRQRGTNRFLRIARTEDRIVRDGQARPVPLLGASSQIEAMEQSLMRYQVSERILQSVTGQADRSFPVQRPIGLTVINYTLEDGRQMSRPAMLFEGLEGEDLSRLHDEGKLDWNSTFSAVSQALQFVHDANAVGINVQDRKAENFVFDLNTQRLGSIDHDADQEISSDVGETIRQINSAIVSRRHIPDRNQLLKLLEQLRAGSLSPHNLWGILDLTAMMGMLKELLYHRAEPDPNIPGRMIKPSHHLLLQRFRPNGQHMSIAADDFEFVSVDRKAPDGSILLDEKGDVQKFHYYQHKRMPNEVFPLDQFLTGLRKRDEGSRMDLLAHQAYAVNATRMAESMQREMGLDELPPALESSVRALSQKIIDIETEIEQFAINGKRNPARRFAPADPDGNYIREVMTEIIQDVQKLQLILSQSRRVQEGVMTDEELREISQALEKEAPLPTTVRPQTYPAKPEEVADTAKEISTRRTARSEIRSQQDGDVEFDPDLGFVIGSPRSEDLPSIPLEEADDDEGAVSLPPARMAQLMGLKQDAASDLMLQIRQRIGPNGKAREGLVDQLGEETVAELESLLPSNFRDWPLNGFQDSLFVSKEAALNLIKNLRRARTILGESEYQSAIRPFNSLSAVRFIYLSDQNLTNMSLADPSVHESETDISQLGLRVTEHAAGALESFLPENIQITSVNPEFKTMLIYGMPKTNADPGVKGQIKVKVNQFFELVEINNRILMRLGSLPAHPNRSAELEAIMDLIDSMVARYQSIVSELTYTPEYDDGSAFERFISDARETRRFADMAVNMEAYSREMKLVRPILQEVKSIGRIYRMGTLNGFINLVHQKALDAVHKSIEKFEVSSIKAQLGIVKAPQIADLIMDVGDAEEGKGVVEIIDLDGTMAITDHPAANLIASTFRRVPKSVLKGHAKYTFFVNDEGYVIGDLSLGGHSATVHIDDRPLDEGGAIYLNYTDVNELRFNLIQKAFEQMGFAVETSSTKIQQTLRANFNKDAGTLRPGYNRANYIAELLQDMMWVVFTAKDIDYAIANSDDNTNFGDDYIAALEQDGGYVPWWAHIWYNELKSGPGKLGNLRSHELQALRRNIDRMSESALKSYKAQREALVRGELPSAVSEMLSDLGLDPIPAGSKLGQREIDRYVNDAIQNALLRGQIRIVMKDGKGTLEKNENYNPALSMVNSLRNLPGDSEELKNGIESAAYLNAIQSILNFETVSTVGAAFYQRALVKDKNGETISVHVLRDIASGQIIYAQTEQTVRRPGAFEISDIKLKNVMERLGSSFPVTANAVQIAGKQRMAQAVLNQTDVERVLPKEQAIFKGLASSPGVKTGRLVYNKQNLKDGDIYLAPYTTPDDNPIFGMEIGMVTTQGAEQSHAALTARGAGIPHIILRDVFWLKGKLHLRSLQAVDGSRQVVDGVETYQVQTTDIELAEGAQVTVDGATGRLIIHGEEGPEGALPIQPEGTEGPSGQIDDATLEVWMKREAQAESAWNVRQQASRAAGVDLSDRDFVRLDETGLDSEAVDMAALVQTMGGKGANLAVMSALGLPVPQGFIVTTNVFQELLDPALRDAIDRRMDEIQRKFNEAGRRLTPALEKEIAGILESIRADILDTEIPPQIENGVQDEFEKLGAERVIVRSSAVDEDSDKPFAGANLTTPDVPSGNLMQAIILNFAALYHPNSIWYRLNNGLNLKQLNHAVVVQKMIKSKKSGVVMTNDPNTLNQNRIIINIARTPGEDVVSGIADTDRIIYDKETGEIEVKVRQGQSEWAFDDLIEFYSLIENAIKIEKYYMDMRDIEFVYDDDEGLQIVQSRRGEASKEAVRQLVERSNRPAMGPITERQFTRETAPGDPGEMRDTATESPDRAEVDTETGQTKRSEMRPGAMDAMLRTPLVSLSGETRESMISASLRESPEALNRRLGDQARSELRRVEDYLQGQTVRVNQALEEETTINSILAKLFSPQLAQMLAMGTRGFVMLDKVRATVAPRLVDFFVAEPTVTTIDTTGIDIQGVSALLGNWKALNEAHIEKHGVPLFPGTIPEIRTLLIPEILLPDAGQTEARQAAGEFLSRNFDRAALAFFLGRNQSDYEPTQFLRENPMLLDSGWNDVNKPIEERRLVRNGMGKTPLIVAEIGSPFEFQSDTQMKEYGVMLREGVARSFGRIPGIRFADQVNALKLLVTVDAFKSKTRTDSQLPFPEAIAESISFMLRYVNSLLDTQAAQLAVERAA